MRSPVSGCDPRQTSAVRRNSTLGGDIANDNGVAYVRDLPLAIVPPRGLPTARHASPIGVLR